MNSLSTKFKAIRLKNNNVREVMEFLNDKKVDLSSDIQRHKFEDYKDNILKYGMPISTQRGIHIATVGDLIIKGENKDTYVYESSVTEKSHFKLSEECELDPICGDDNSVND